VVPATAQLTCSTPQTYIAFESPSALCNDATEDPPQPNHIIGGDELRSTHPYYCQLLSWDTDNLSEAIPSIGTAIATGDLHSCADGSHIDDYRQGA
jgi:hypothetical protein